jgi:hypothetical protein
MVSSRSFPRLNLNLKVRPTPFPTPAFHQIPVMHCSVPAGRLLQNGAIRISTTHARAAMWGLNEERKNRLHFPQHSMQDLIDELPLLLRAGVELLAHDLAVEAPQPAQQNIAVELGTAVLRAQVFDAALHQSAQLLVRDTVADLADPLERAPETQVFVDPWNGHDQRLDQGGGRREAGHCLLDSAGDDAVMVQAVWGGGGGGGYRGVLARAGRAPPPLARVLLWRRPEGGELGVLLWRKPGGGEWCYGADRLTEIGKQGYGEGRKAESGKLVYNARGGLGDTHLES